MFECVGVAGKLMFEVLRIVYCTNASLLTSFFLSFSTDKKVRPTTARFPIHNPDPYKACG